MSFKDIFLQAEPTKKLECCRAYFTIIISSDERIITVHSFSCVTLCEIIISSYVFRGRNNIHFAGWIERSFGESISNGEFILYSRTRALTQGERIWALRAYRDSPCTKPTVVGWAQPPGFPTIRVIFQKWSRAPDLLTSKRINLGWRGNKSVLINRDDIKNYQRVFTKSDIFNLS